MLLKLFTTPKVKLFWGSFAFVSGTIFFFLSFPFLLLIVIEIEASVVDANTTSKCETKSESNEKEETDRLYVLVVSVRIFVQTIK